MSRLRKGQDFERIHRQFSNKTIGNFEVQQIFNDKWVILKVLGWRGEACCYEVCDKKATKFGTLYVEIALDAMNFVSNQADFAHKQYSQGNSHRFTTAVDCGLLNNHVFYTVFQHRPGPSLSSLLEVCPSGLSPATVAFIATDLISLVEILASTGYVLRNFDARQWGFNVKSRQLFLGDFSDIIVISDKRYSPFHQPLYECADQLDLHWSSEDLTYAPISYFNSRLYHRMSELDLMEVMLYVIYELAYTRLPWKNSKSAEKTLQMKTEFMETLPELVMKTEKKEDGWLHVALQNTLKYIKEAAKEQERLEKLPVRDGAWCPNGARAGALISAVKYREILDDFHKIVVAGCPTWTMHWRDVILDWEEPFQHTGKSMQILEKMEIRERAWDVLKETERLMGKRTHYTIMREHAEAQTQKNKIAISDYLEGRQQEEDVEKKKPVRRYLLRKRNSKKKTKDEVKEEEVEEEAVVKKEEDSEVVKQEEDEIEFPSSRAARLQRRQQSIQLRQIKEQNAKTTKAKKVQIGTGEEDAPIKLEEPDSYDELEDVKVPVVEKEEEEEEDDSFEIKIEEPDDYE